MSSGSVCVLSVSSRPIGVPVVAVGDTDSEDGAAGVRGAAAGVAATGTTGGLGGGATAGVGAGFAGSSRSSDSAVDAAGNSIGLLKTARFQAKQRRRLTAQGSYRGVDRLYENALSVKLQRFYVRI